MIPKRMYYFSRTYQEVRQFAVAANSYEEAVKMLEDDQFAEISMLYATLSQGYSSKFRRTWSEKIRDCINCGVAISIAHFRDDVNRPVEMSISGDKCFKCYLKGSERNGGGFTMKDCCDQFKYFRWSFKDSLKRYPNNHEMHYKYCPYCGADQSGDV